MSRWLHYDFYSSYGRQQIVRIPICSLSDDLPDYQSHIQQEVNTIATDSYHTAIRQPDSSYTDLSAYQNGSTDSACSLQPNPKHDSDDDLYELDEMTVQDFLAKGPQ